MPQPEPTVHELFDLTGKAVLITGATGHLGSAMARALAEAGANVVVSSRSRQRARDFAATLPRPGGAAHYGVKLDYMDPDSIERGFGDALKVAGRLDVLVNNGNQPVAADWTTAGAEQLARQLANGTGFFLLARLMRAHAVQRRAPASIIMIGSMYGLVGSYPDAYADICNASPVGYHMLKAGVIQLTRHLAVYWAHDNVRVNCLSPGPFPGREAPPALPERLSEKSPMRRMGRARELKGAIVFLASDASSYMTGQNLIIDGGWTAW